jgi:L-histidine N-alpha-methyltransferase
MLADNLTRLRSHRVQPVRALPGLRDEVVEGLLEPPRSLPPKYFYDDRGSRLFDAICNTPEYYPTRIEESLLAGYAADIIERVHPAHILEFGSGTARKTRHLLDACVGNGGATYWPFDVCEEMLLESGGQLVRDYGWLEVNVLVGDYFGGLDNLPALGGNCLYLFLGGTIGNFTEPQARQFLTELRAVMGGGDRLLLGADRVKDADVLHAAYNDRAGVTAEFNLNLLHVLNRELDADFEPGGFRHRAVFNDRASQIEMYLVSGRPQSVRLGALDCSVRFERGETILTEISRKFTPARLHSLLAETGFAVERHFEPDNGYFSLLLASPTG